MFTFISLIGDVANALELQIIAKGPNYYALSDHHNHSVYIYTDSAEYLPFDECLSLGRQINGIVPRSIVLPAELSLFR